ncbi:hypothetical protein ACTXT7_017250 [Hymenolepis weldensis]
MLFRFRKFNVLLALDTLLNVPGALQGGQTLIRQGIKITELWINCILDKRMISMCYRLLVPKACRLYSG